jgi:hypothetical protein
LLPPAYDLMHALLENTIFARVVVMNHGFAERCTCSTNVREYSIPP